MVASLPHKLLRCNRRRNCEKLNVARCLANSFVRERSASVVAHKWVHMDDSVCVEKEGRGRHAPNLVVREGTADTQLMQLSEDFS